MSENPTSEELSTLDFELTASARGLTLLEALYDEREAWMTPLHDAAHDLLKVAQSVVYVHEHSGSNAQFVLRGLVDDARAAIAKATGAQA